MTVLRAIVTAGGTREPIDAVRQVSNVASGALPAAIANCLLRHGFTVHFIHGPGSALPATAQIQLNVLKMTPEELAKAAKDFSTLAQDLQRDLTRGNLNLHPIQTAAEAHATLAALCRSIQPALVICAMAVADFSPNAVDGKLPSRTDGHADSELVVRMAPTAKTIDCVKQNAPECHLLGFKLLAGAAESELTAAAKLLAVRSRADLIFANDINDYRQGWRRGLLIEPSGAIAARLDAGAGADATAQLANAIIAQALEHFHLEI